MAEQRENIGDYERTDYRQVEQELSRFERNYQERATSEKQEVYETDLDAAEAGVKNGVVGKVLGFLKGIWTIVTEFVGIAIQNILFRNRDSFNFTRALNNAQGRTVLNDATKKNEEKAKERDSLNKDNGKKDQPEKDSERRDSQEEESPEKEEMNAGADGEFQEKGGMSAHERDSYVTEILQNEDVEKYLNQYDVIAVDTYEDTEHIFVGFDGSDSKFYKIPKEDFITGRADSLSAAMYFNTHKETPDEKDYASKLESALNSVLLMGKIRCTNELSRMESHLMKNEPVRLSSTFLKTQDGVSELSLEMTNKNDEETVNIVYNGKVVDSMPFNTFLNEKVSEHTMERLLSSYEQAITGEVEIGEIRRKDDVIISCAKDINPDGGYGPKGTVFVKDSRKTDDVIQIGSYDFTTEAGVRDLKEDLQSYLTENKLNVSHYYSSEISQNTRFPISPESISYCIGAVINPDMQPVILDSGKYMDPMSGEERESGAVHFELQSTEYGNTVYMNVPVQEPIGENESAIKMESVKIFSYSSYGEIINSPDSATYFAVDMEKHLGDYLNNELEVPDHIRISHDYMDPYNEIAPAPLEEVDTAIEQYNMRNLLDGNQERMIQRNIDAFEQVGYDAPEEMLNQMYDEDYDQEPYENVEEDHGPYSDSYPEADEEEIYSIPEIEEEESERGNYDFEMDLF